MIISTFLVLTISNSLYCQVKKSSQFQRIYLPDSVKTKIALFDLSKSAFENDIDSSYRAILAFKLTANDGGFTNGVYEYKRLISHEKSRLFIFYNNKICLFSSLDIDDFLVELAEYYKEINLTKTEKIQYLKAISLFFDGNL
jgi:hypothetical protein